MRFVPAKASGMECACGSLCGLQVALHPEKTKIVYCKDANRRGAFPVISFDFLGFQFRARWQGKSIHNFPPGAG